jgi:hypothetical protein
VSAPLAGWQSGLLQAFIGFAVLTLGGCGIPTSGPLGEAVEWHAAAQAESDSKKLPNIAISSYALKSAILGTSTNSVLVGTVGPSTGH